jgi:hypothetical protein
LFCRFFCNSDFSGHITKEWWFFDPLLKKPILNHQ